ncbi:MAG: nucleotidyl transferase AbiEii/AbiGii toxin family protein [Methylobacteriaceae bacterium]|nr:nucleotidyl transferase AbiEii/AbiGii toxin family protein [Methylobacteriaceae bacterium]
MGAQAVTAETWKELLAAAVRLFDDLHARGFGSPDVILGRGTVLMLRFGHRLSKDIDIFLHDVHWLSLLTPRLNDVAAAMAVDYVEQANSIKLIMPNGDIDIIAAAAVTDVPPRETIEFMGRTFRLEATEEILAKKLLYRAESLKPRDIFDLVVVGGADPDAAARAIAATSVKNAVVQRRLEQMSPLAADELARDIFPIGDFASIVPNMIAKARNLISGDRLLDRSRP